MEYISCFSGIGGLEGSLAPKAVCEIDEECRELLSLRFPEAKQFNDIRTMDGIEAEVIVGGWPCQDLSVAGKQAGLQGENSGLFYSFIDAANEIKAQTLIAENVTNLLRMDKGAVFFEVLIELKKRGFGYCSWRVINARQFGLPHHRNRVFLIASRDIQRCYSLFRDLPEIDRKTSDTKAAGFYWTAGSQSICFSKGYVPTIKIGSTLKIASPPAVFYGDTVRKLSSNEALQLQGFSPEHFSNFADSTKFKMAGNAVAKPIGQFVVDGVISGDTFNAPELAPSQTDFFGNSIPSGGMPEAGFFDGETISRVQLGKKMLLANNLGDFLDTAINQRLSARAASGLLRRLDKSGHSCPDELKLHLERLAKENAHV